MQRILVIDRDESALAPQHPLLRSRGFDVASAPSGKVAITRLRCERFDVVLTELRLPDMDALEFALAVRKNHRFLPVIVMSDGGESPDLLGAFASLGAVHALRKPGDVEALLEAITAVLRATAEAIAMIPPRRRVRPGIRNFTL